MTGEMRPEWHGCDYCYARTFGDEPVHGQGNPCPVKMAESIALVEMMESQSAMADAQRATYTGAGFMTADMNEMMSTMMKKLFGEQAEE